MSKLRSAAESVHRFIYEFTERFHDWRYGIHTAAYIDLREFGITDPSCHLYNGTNYRRFPEMLRQIEIRPGEDVFLDFGSGMGRVVIMAARYPFRKVIGVEVVPELDQIARENVRRSLTHLRCQDIELCLTDARTYAIPPEVSVIYLWNPFGPDILDRVLENIHQSVRTSPREVRILYFTPPGVQYIDECKNLGWLKEVKRVVVGRRGLLTVYACDGQEPAAASPSAR